LRQRRRVVDTVAGHGNDPAFVLQTLDDLGFFGRQNLSFEVFDSEAPRNLLGGSLVVAGEHDQEDALGFQFA
jgi:hypothetical protein